MPGLITVHIDGQLVRKGLQNLSDEIPKVGRLQIYNAALRIRTGMRVRGPRPSWPIQWDSPRQRIAFFASEGFGGGIPHTRTDQYVDSWQLERIGDIGYRVFNFSNGAEAIAGDVVNGVQSKIHKGRWPVFRSVVLQEVEKLPQEISREIKVVAARNGLLK